MILVYLLIAAVFAMVWILDNGSSFYEGTIEASRHYSSDTSLFKNQVDMEDRLAASLIVLIVAVAYGAVWAFTVGGKVKHVLERVKEVVTEACEGMAKNLKRGRRRQIKKIIECAPPESNRNPSA